MADHANRRSLYRSCQDSRQPFHNRAPSSRIRLDPMRSFTADRIHRLQPRYCSVVCIETCPKRNWTFSNSPPDAWQSRAQVRRKLFGANCATPILLADFFTMCQMRRCFTILPMEWQRILPGCPWLEPSCPWLSLLVTSLLSGHAFLAYFCLHEEFQVNLRILAIAL